MVGILDLKSSMQSRQFLQNPRLTNTGDATVRISNQELLRKYTGQRCQFSHWHTG